MRQQTKRFICMLIGCFLYALAMQVTSIFNYREPVAFFIGMLTQSASYELFPNKPEKEEAS